MGGSEQVNETRNKLARALEQGRGKIRRAALHAQKKLPMLSSSFTLSLLQYAVHATPTNSSAHGAF